MNLSDIRTSLSYHINDQNTTNNPRFDQTFRDFAINVIYKEILASHPFWFLDDRITATLVPGQNWITRPDNINTIIGIYLTTETKSKKLGEVNIKQRDVFDIDGSLGNPTSYMVSGNRIYFYPQPINADNVVIVYSKNVVDLSDSFPNVVDGFDADWHYLIPLGAAAYLFMTKRGSDLQNAQYFMNKYREGLALMKANFNRKQKDRFTQIQDVQSLPYPLDVHGYM